MRSTTMHRANNDTRPFESLGVIRRFDAETGNGQVWLAQKNQLAKFSGCEVALPENLLEDERVFVGVRPLSHAYLVLNLRRIEDGELTADELRRISDGYDNFLWEGFKASLHREKMAGPRELSHRERGRLEHRERQAV